MKKKTYYELLLDPRWQQKKTEILQRDNFTCQHCGCKDRTLHVHHLMYSKDAKPWEYDNKYLLTLCDSCHENDTEYSRESYALFLETKRRFEEMGFSHTVLNQFFEYIIDYFAFYQEGIDVGTEDTNSLLESLFEHIVFSTQAFSDLRVLRKLSSNKVHVNNYLSHLYPNLVID